MKSKPVIKNTTLLAAILLFLASCSGSFLEIYPESALSEDDFYNSETEYVLLANGCYIPMRDYEKNWHWILAELTSDNASFQNNIRTGEAIRGVIDQFIQVSGNQAYANFWNLSYQGVTRCNKLLHELDRGKVVWTTPAIKERCAGEALFLRALYYFNLVRQFGGVPLVLTPITSQEALNYQRVSEQEIYDAILSDLQKAAVHFAAAREVEEKGRAGEEAAYGLLGKVYLTLHRYSEAAEVLRKVIDSGRYVLLQDYAALFTPAAKDYRETLFAIQYSESNAESANNFIFNFAPHTSEGQVTQRPKVNIISAGWNQPTDDLIRAFEKGDLRKDVAIGIWTGIDWDAKIRPIPYCAKYKPPVSAPDNRCSDNFPILRYADVLLMYAEALNESGQTAAAIPYLAQVRKRAGLETSGTPDRQSLRTLILKERQVELCFENQRWYDLKRTGIAQEVMTAHGIREKAKKAFLYPEAYQLTPEKLLAPIPANEVLVNKLTQNPGY